MTFRSSNPTTPANLIMEQVWNNKNDTREKNKNDKNQNVENGYYKGQVFSVTNPNT